MIKSMTGYGRGESDGRHGIIKAEIKTLNNKFFEMGSKLPDGLAVFEDRIREYVQKRIKRGRVNLSVNYEHGGKKEKRVVLDRKLASFLLNEMKRFKRAERLKGEIDLNKIMAFPGVLTYSDLMTD